MTESRPLAVAVVLVVAASAASCGGGSGSSTAAPQAAIQKVPSASGDGQTGTVGTALASPLRVLVTLSGSPLAGDTVTWSASGTGASVAPTRAVTDANGVGATVWTLGQVAGSQNASAAASATGSPVTFTATASAGAATQLLKVAGDSQVGVPGSNLTLPVAVGAADAFGNSVPGVGISWAVTSGPATVDPASATTTANGSQATVRLGTTAGQIVVTAASPGLAGSPVTFNERAAFPATAGVRIGDFYFVSARNGSENPAVDTIGVGGRVTWTWGGNANHGVQSIGSSSFTGSVVQALGNYSFTFASAGTYDYDCTVHGITMTGTIVVR